MADDAPKVKEDQSRQQATYGAAAMAMLKKTHVIVSGMNGLGAEIAKNTILASVKSVTLHDTKEAVISDLGAHFYLTESDVGTNRAEACLPQLQELNPNVGVRAASGSLLDVLAAGVPAQGSAPAAAFSICVAIDLGGAEAQAVNEFCRTQETPIKFIRTDARGLFGQLFCDFGDEFTVYDATGEQAKHAILASVQLGAEETRCECLFDDEGRHHLEDYDTVRFTEIRGATELNEGTFQVKVVNAYSFTLGSKDDEGNWVPLDSSSFGAYEGGGIMTQVKQPVVLNFKSLAEANVSPGMFLESDFSKWGASGLNHVLFQALDKFIDAHDGALPQPCNADDAAEIILLAKEVSATLENPIEEIDEAKATKFAHGASAVLNPMAAIFGGIAGQEVVKAATGKYHPCHQYFLYDSLECLPDDDLPASEFALEGTRYDANITVFGKSWQEKVVQQKWFLVGAGALGCEFLKNFCLMGVGCSAEGLVTVTDDDIIELSNLTRQFLFRNWHVGSNKSTTAAEAAQAMNPAFNIVARADRVSPNTESTFNDEFWGSLDGVCNALDNVKARLYVDNKCVFYGKPLLESGTLGTKCNVQVVKPHDTEHYGASVDPPEKEAPQCTVHNFPHNIDHCLVWARSEFVGNFETVPTETAKYIEKGAAYLTDLREANAAQGDIEENIRGDKLWGGGILGMLVEDQTNDWASCVAWARNAFEKYSRNMILQLTTSFPRDAKTNKGTDFWVAPKRFPEPLPFDDQDDMTMQFITAAACLRAKVNGVALPAAFDDWSNTPDQRDTVFAFMRGEMSDVEVPEFVPNTNVKIKTDEDGDDDGDDDAAASNAPVDIDAVFASLPSGDALAGVTVTPEEFEKDDETNFHMDFIHALANLRARNYEITEIDQLEARLKAGRIIPAIATTTAMVTGFVMLEFCKLINDRPIEAFRNSFANLALPLFAISEPMPPRKAESRTEKNVPDPINHPEYVEEEEITAYPEGHTIWDSIECRPPNGDFTVQEFKDWWQAEHGLTLSSMTIGVALIYADYLPAHRERLDKTLISLVNDVAGVQIEDHVNCLMPVCALRDADGKDVDLARLVYYFR